VGAAARESGGRGAVRRALTSLQCATPAIASQGKLARRVNGLISPLAAKCSNVVLFLRF
jgi:hypothetical protein